MESDEDFRSLFSIPLSSLFNFQRGTAGPQQQLPTVNGQYGLVQQQPGSSTVPAAFGNFTSQSSADSAHFSSNEEEQCGSPLIKCDASTPINLLELGFEPTDMEIDSQMAFPAGSLTGRPNHSEVEKMRRDRMNGSIGEMAAFVPACKSASRKLDKLTVLRLTVQHIKLVRARAASMVHTPVEIFASDELRHLLSRKASLQGFVLVVECDRARILCATNCDNSGVPGACINSSDLIGQCFLDLVHPRDAEVVKQQLAVPDLAQRQWGDHGGGGHSLRRRFFCRFRAPIGSSSSSGRRKYDTRQYVYLSCSGLLHWSDPVVQPITDPAAAAAAPGDQSEESQQKQQSPATQSTCLTLLCRPAEPLMQSVLPATVRSGQDWQFAAKLNLEAGFTWVDQRVASILGHLPQDLLGSSLYDLVSREDVNRLTVAHRSALKGTRSRVACRVRCAWQAGGDAACQLSLVSFVNPCTGRPELLSLTCALQPAAQQQLQQPAAQQFSFPSVVQSTDPPVVTSPPLRPGGPAMIGSRVASELQLLTITTNNNNISSNSNNSSNSNSNCNSEAASAVAATAGWMALGQLISASHRHHQPAEAAVVTSADGGDSDGESLATTRMCLLGADGGLGEEPDYGSMLWPL